MREKMKKIVSTVLLCALLVNAFCVSTLAADSEKIEPELRQIMNAASEDELIPVWLWKQSISGQKIDQMLLEEYGIDSAEYEQNPDRYIEERRVIVRREYSALNDSFIETYVGEGRRVLYNSRYTSTLIVEATKAEIEEYAKLDAVQEISLYEEEKADTTDERDIQIGSYVFTFGFGSMSERFYIHKDGGFILVKDAYEAGILSDEDVASLAAAFGNARELRCDYTDVREEDWFYEYVNEMYVKGIMTGYSDSDYWGMADDITREQLVTVMYRYAKGKGYDVSQTGDVSGFSDAGAITAFAKEAMKWAVGNHIIQGKYDGKIIDPQGYTTRAECAAITQRFTEKYE